MNTPPDDLGFLFVWTTVFWGGAEYQPFKPWLSSHDQNRHPTLLSSESLVLDDSPGVRLSTHECQTPNIIPVKNKKYFTLLPNSYFFPPREHFNISKSDNVNTLYLHENFPDGEILQV